MPFHKFLCRHLEEINYIFTCERAIKTRFYHSLANFDLQRNLPQRWLRENIALYEMYSKDVSEKHLLTLFFTVLSCALTFLTKQSHKFSQLREFLLNFVQ